MSRSERQKLTKHGWFAAGDVAQLVVFVVFVERPWRVFPTDCRIKTSSSEVVGGTKHKISKPWLPPPLETSAGRLRGTNPLPWAPLDEAANLDCGFGCRKAVVAWLVESFPCGVVPKKSTLPPLDNCAAGTI